MFALDKPNCTLVNNTLTVSRAGVLKSPKSLPGRNTTEMVEKVEMVTEPVGSVTQYCHFGCQSKWTMSPLSSVILPICVVMAAENWNKIAFCVTSYA